MVGCGEEGWSRRSSEKLTDTAVKRFLDLFGIWNISVCAGRKTHEQCTGVHSQPPPLSAYNPTRRDDNRRFKYTYARSAFTEDDDARRNLTRNVFNRISFFTKTVVYKKIVYCIFILIYICIYTLINETNCGCIVDVTSVKQWF